MIRYHGAPYEGSDDHANDLLAAEQRRRDGVACLHCKHFHSQGAFCAQHRKPTTSDGWCSVFARKSTRRGAANR